MECMDETTFTVFFENPFWVGVVERVQDGKLFCARHVFGAEPTNNDVENFLCNHYGELKFSPALSADKKEKAENPKRREREAKKQMVSCGIGTKSQQALKLLQEEFKTERKQKSREERLTESLARFEIRQAKKKEKRRGH